MGKIWTCNQIRIIFGSDRIKNFGLSSVEQAAADHVSASRQPGLVLQQSLHPWDGDWLCVLMWVMSVTRSASLVHVRWRCCVCCRVVTADWLCVCVWWEARCVYVVTGYDCVFVWWVMCCVLCVHVWWVVCYSKHFFFKFCVAQLDFWIGSGWINSWLRGSSASQTRIFSDQIRLFATPTKYGLSTTSN